jgi:DNA replication protein DnaC
VPPRGPSLLLLGPTGVGKTHEAFGALRGLAERMSLSTIRAVTAADLYARLRPRAGVDAEAEFERYAAASLLLLDDLGAAKTSEWVEEVNYRLINHRYNEQLATLITSNVPAGHLGAQLGERVASRLTEMCVRVVLKGSDRRRAS